MAGANPTLDAAKSKVAEAVDRLSGELEALSLQIHGNPELCFKEEEASAWLAEFLGKHGAQVERGVGGLPTAFRATIRGRRRPTVPFSPSTTRCPHRHACGHTSSRPPAPGRARRSPPRSRPCPSRVHPVIGTPAERAARARGSS